MADVTSTAALVRPAPGAVIKRKKAYEALAPGNAVYLKSDDTVAKADADAEATAQVVGIVISVPNGGEACAAGDNVDICVFGEVFGFTSLTPGALAYASTTAGAIADAAPAGSSGDYLYIVGRAWTAGSIFVNPFTTDFAAQ